MASDKDTGSTPSGDAKKANAKPTGAKGAAGKDVGTKDAGTKATSGKPPLMKRSGPPPTLDATARDVTASKSADSAKTPDTKSDAKTETKASAETLSTASSKSSAAASDTKKPASSTPDAAKPASSTATASSAAKPSAAAPKPSTAAPAPRKPTASSGGTGRLALAAGLGGVVGGGLIWLLMGLTDGETLDAEALEARLAALETAEPAQPDLTPLDTRIAAIETDLASGPETEAETQAILAQLRQDLDAQTARLAEVGEAEPALDTAPLEAGVADAIAAAQQALTAAQAAAQQAAAAEARIAELASTEGDASDPRVSAIASEVTQLRTAAQEALANLDQRVTALSEATPETSALARAEDVDALSQTVSALDTRLGDVPARVETLSTQQEALQNTLAAVESAQSSVQSTLSQVRASVESVQTSLSEADQQATLRVDGLDRRLAELSTRVEAAEAQLDRPDDRARAAAALNFAGLQSAAERGQDFSASVEALAATGALPAATLDALRAQSAGVPSVTELARQWDRAAVAARRAAVRAEGTSGVTGLFTSARALIDVTPSEPGEGTSVPAQVARIERALSRGDLTAALEGWNALPEPSRRATADWGEAAQARADLLAALGDASRALAGER